MSGFNQIHGCVIVWFSIVSFGFTTKPYPANQSERIPIACDEVEVKVKLTHTSQGLKNGEVLLEFNKEPRSFTSFVFSGSDSNNNQLGVKDTKISDLGTGDYNLYIQTEDGCSKHLKFKIN